MAKSKQTFGKKEKEKKRLKKRQDKQKKLEERKAGGKADFDDMIAYVDENGNITDTPPDPMQKSKVEAESIEISTPKKEDIEIDPVHTGRVDFFDHSKGFGFIIEKETRERFFVHVNGLTEEIVEGNIVSFELEKGLKGMNAVKVKKV
ncbi:cold-shock protein [Carboxylicivirga linearis]|uniref:Cold shock domain-containing protein n=1 Tax=Carboxylicivirga linearis TaxID=1628157 RepID=A0ABS5JRM5_9BACT|nr:cold shock domain-containing protein [Carboxylicivirga linearis]MBS2097558.1 cold shock domain-containing protein [Carboxylicivirga linearis]